MRNSYGYREPVRSRVDARVAALLAVLVALGGVVAVVRATSGAQAGQSAEELQLAASRSQSDRQACIAQRSGQAVGPWSRTGTYTRDGATHHLGDGQAPRASTRRQLAACGGDAARTTAGGAAGAAGGARTNAAQTVNCPTVRDKVGNVPARARAEVDRELGVLENQINEANARLARLAERPEGGPNFVQNAIIGPLEGKRTAVLDRIGIAINRAGGQRPNGLGDLAKCTANAPAAGGNQGGQGGNQGGQGGQGGNQGGQGGNQGGQGGNQGGNQGGQGGNQGGGQGNNGGENNGLDILGNNCEGSRLQPHDGFQNGNRCVSTSFGEVTGEANNPSLLIKNAPGQVGVNQAFDIQVSTQNLVRDRFLAAGQGGYYLESSFLNGQGLTRGHFHTACRMLNGTDAQEPAPAPAFFVATEDGGGGGNPDTVTVRVAGLPAAGTAQCAVWAGDGSHRVPMMQRANQIPAFDVVRVQVR